MLGAAAAAGQRAPPEYYPRPVGPANTLGELFLIYGLLWPLC